MRFFGRYVSLASTCLYNCAARAHVGIGWPNAARTANEPGARWVILCPQPAHQMCAGHALLHSQYKCSACCVRTSAVLHTACPRWYATSQGYCQMHPGFMLGAQLVRCRMQAMHVLQAVALGAAAAICIRPPPSSTLGWSNGHPMCSTSQCLG